MSTISCYDYSSNWIQALENVSLISKYDYSKVQSSDLRYSALYRVRVQFTNWQFITTALQNFPQYLYILNGGSDLFWEKLTFLTVLSRILLLVFLKIKVINWLCKYKDTTHCCVCTSHNIYLERAEEDSKVTKTTTSGGVTGSQMTGMGGGV